MFARYVYEKTSAEYRNKILLIDTDNLECKTNYLSIFDEHGFQVIRYENDLLFRSRHNEALSGKGRYVVIAKNNDYIPYDIRCAFYLFSVSLSDLFPKLNGIVLREAKQLNFDLLTLAYKNNFNDLNARSLTEQFIQNEVYGQKNIKEYLRYKLSVLSKIVDEAQNYKDWFTVANCKAEIDVLATEYEIAASTEHIQEHFLSWIMEEYGKLSSKIDRESPILVSRAMEFMHDHSEKFVIIVMDGMSEFDWQILSNGFNELKYEKSDVFAMIPTITSVSRQCLLSNKYPAQLTTPWQQSKEKPEFISCALNLGYTISQVAYERGYEAEFRSTVKCAAVIINEIDDTVHGQGQGRQGMLNDIKLMSKQSKLIKLVKSLISQGFDVYISSDHGNTPCIGDGKLVGTGVETQTKSRRMMVLKDFADKQTIIDRYQMIDFPKYYLDKKYDYLICPPGHSLDAKGAEVMSHGGITTDECIVPFIRIKSGENNG